MQYNQTFVYLEDLSEATFLEVSLSRGLIAVLLALATSSIVPSPIDIHQSLPWC